MRILRLFVLTVLSGAVLADEKTANRSTPAPAELPTTVPTASIGDLRKAQAAFAGGDLAGARRAYEQALSKAPENVYLLTNLGVVYFREMRYPQAEVVLQKSVKLAPNDDFSHATLGTVYFAQQRFDEALAELDVALRLNPKNAEAHGYKGICASAKGQQGVARQELETALSLDPNLADAHFNLAVVYATQQPPDTERARRHYQRARELGAEPDNKLEQTLK